MQSILAFVLVSSMIIVAHAQSWAGNYTIDGTTCNQMICCCLRGTLVVTQSTGSLYMNSALSGSLCLSNSSSLWGSTSTDYNASMSQVGNTGNTGNIGNFGNFGNFFNIGNMGKLAIDYLATLSSDSNTINLVNPSLPMCAARAVRSNITMMISGAEKHAITTTSVAAGLLLAVINRMSD